MDYNRIGEGNELSGFIKNACGKESLAISGTLAGWRIKVDFRKKILETGGAITMGNFFVGLGVSDPPIQGFSLMADAAYFFHGFPPEVSCCF
jgi:hypothetical protein